MKNKRTEIIILLETIKENINRNPKLGLWQGILMCNSKEYHWRVTEKPLDVLIEEKEE